MATRQKVSGLWVGGTLPWMPRLCIKSFLDHGIDFQLFVYRNYPNIPEGAIVRDARDILPEEHLFTLKNSVELIASFSDWFRYELLLREGGFWVDVDLICVADSIPDVPIWACKEAHGIVANGVIAFPRGNDVVRCLRDLARDPADPMPWDTDEAQQKKYELKKIFPTERERREHAPWGYAGPMCIDKVLTHYKMLHVVAPTHEVYAVAGPDWKKFYNGELHLDSPEFKDSWGLHLYNGMLCREPSVAASLKKDSVIGQLLDRHFPGQTLVPTC